MAHLIDKDALVAEIEKRINFNEKLNAHSRLDECNAILSFLDTLEVKEVDLEKENIIGTLERAVKIDAGGYPYIDCSIELYDYNKDIPLAKEGDKVKIIVIKGE